jgi:hypothetical protein
MGGLLSFRLFGFPVTIHGSFLLLIAFLAYSGSPEVADFVGFALITLSSQNRVKAPVMPWRRGRRVRSPHQ